MPATSLFRVTLRMDVVPGAEQQFEEAWLAGAERIADEPGNVGQWLSQGERDNAFYVVSDWVSREAFLAYERSPQHLEHRRSLDPLRTAGEMTTMRTLHRLDGKGGNG
ncbi:MULTISPECIES: antibiotic biosynthesis monooxygenase family protein [Kitasatospora]|uniref:Antibiotic biosynthesis monooxygenase n=1 Tax=Kitasatospora cystarginea TaxID=58350 RepID=A0ABN3EX73_9ACTN